MKQKIVSIVLAATVLVAAGCTNAEKSAMSAWGKKHKVQLYSGGKLIGEWISSGKIENEERSNGYYFQDDKTGKIVMINGDIIITLE